MTTYYKAVHALVGGAMSGPTDGPVSEMIFNDDQTPPTEEAIQVKLQELRDDYNAKQYQRDRAFKYPSIQEQLDMQYHDLVNGTTTWKDAIAKVKTENPKSE